MVLVRFWDRKIVNRNMVMDVGMVRVSRVRILILLVRKIINVVILLVIREILLELMVNIIRVMNCRCFFSFRLRDRISEYEINVVVILFVKDEKMK